MTTRNYEIRVVGSIGPAAREAFSGMGVDVEPTITVLSGPSTRAACTRCWTGCARSAWSSSRCGRSRWTRIAGTTWSDSPGAGDDDGAHGAHRAVRTPGQVTEDARTARHPARRRLLGPAVRADLLRTVPWPGDRRRGRGARGIARRRGHQRVEAARGLRAGGLSASRCSPCGRSGLRACYEASARQDVIAVRRGALHLNRVKRPVPAVHATGTPRRALRLCPAQQWAR